jgi:hypothetical protein
VHSAAAATTAAHAPATTAADDDDQDVRGYRAIGNERAVGGEDVRDEVRAVLGEVPRLAARRLRRRLAAGAARRIAARTTARRWRGRTG